MNACLKANINEFLQEISEGGEEPLSLPELDPAEGEEHCPESEFLQEEEEEEEGDPSSSSSPPRSSCVFCQVREPLRLMPSVLQR